MGAFFNHVGIILGVFWDHFVDILEAFWAIGALLERSGDPGGSEECPRASKCRF